MTDHRTRRPTIAGRRSVALGAALFAVVLGGGCGTARDDAAPAAPTTPSTTAPAPTGTAARPTPSAEPTVTIPTSAFLELPAELRRTPRATTPVENALPELCGAEFGTGGRAVTASAAMTSAYKQADDPPENVPHGTISQTIFTFEGTGATDYLRRVRGSLDACPSFERSGVTVRVGTRPLPGVGDEALVVTQTWPQLDLQGNRTGGDAVTQTAVIRVDGVATVLHDQGWEGTSGSPALLGDFTGAAVRALDTWRR
ncbi:hypothetical protein [Micromonospora sp. CPCC 205561]|uniref:hypothetical protein n=1 Tax=Micromonospora sp. CPCC 205561 TaxID=3122407 RepID=UPI002FF336B6